MMKITRNAGSLRLEYNFSMPASLSFLRRLMGLAILTFSSGIFIWGVWPLREASQSVLIPPDLRLDLAWPTTARVGDAQTIRMRLEPGQENEQKTASTPFPAGELASNVMVAARLEFAGLQFYPVGMVNQPLRPEKPVAFHWQFRPGETGIYTGVAWLYLITVPLNGDAETLTPVSAKEIQMRAVSIFGLGGPAARLLGGLGILAGGLLGLDGGLAWLLNRSRQQSKLQRTSGLSGQ